jgi:hypothetical protein
MLRYVLLIYRGKRFRVRAPTPERGIGLIDRTQIFLRRDVACRNGDHRNGQPLISAASLHGPAFREKSR